MAVTFDRDVFNLADLPSVRCECGDKKGIKSENEQIVMKD